jgi:hypothetical protein
VLQFACPFPKTTEDSIFMKNASQSESNTSLLNGYDYTLWGIKKTHQNVFYHNIHKTGPILKRFGGLLLI